MLFKDLKVGDTIYVNNPKQWNKPIKKTIGKILSFGTDSLGLVFYAENGDYIGGALLNRSHGISSGIFADFDAFKESWIDYHKNKIQHIEAEMKEIGEALENACQLLAAANNIEDED